MVARKIIFMLISGHGTTDCIQVRGGQAPHPGSRCAENLVRAQQDEHQRGRCRDDPQGDREVTTLERLEAWLKGQEDRYLDYMATAGECGFNA